VNFMLQQQLKVTEKERELERVGDAVLGAVGRRLEDTNKKLKNLKETKRQ